MISGNSLVHFVPFGEQLLPLHPRNDALDGSSGRRPDWPFPELEPSRDVSQIDFRTPFKAIHVPNPVKKVFVTLELITLGYYLLI